MQIILGLSVADRPLQGKTASENAHRLLRDMLTDIRQESAACTEISRDEHGRPFLKSCPGRIDFNLSHAGKYAVCAIAVAEHEEESPRVGVDLEIPHPRISAKRIAERFFAEEEIAYLAEADFREDLFLDLWTKKEAYLKFVGTGLSGGMKQVSILHAEDLDPAVRLIAYTVPEDPAAHLTLCIPSPATPPKTIRMY